MIRSSLLGESTGNGISTSYSTRMTDIIIVNELGTAGLERNQKSIIKLLRYNNFDVVALLD